MKYANVKAVFDYHVEIDGEDKLARDVITYTQRFMTKNDIHVNFFGSALIGTEAVRYTPVERLDWLENVLNIEDIEECRTDIHDLKDINKDYKVSGDIINLSNIWVLNKLFNSNIGDKLKEQALLSCLNMAMFKHLTGGIKNRFPHGADPLIAMTLYESLDRKTDLKATGSWLGMITKKSNVFLEPKGVFRDVLEDMSDDLRVVEFANEISGRVTKSLNELTHKFMEIHSNQSKINSSSKLANIDGEVLIRDYVSKPKKLVDDMERITRDENQFIKEELTVFVTDLVSTCSTVSLKKAQKYFSENFLTGRTHRDLQKDLILYILSVSRRDHISLSNIPSIISHLRGIFRASNVSSKEVKGIKKDSRKIIEKALPGAGQSNIVAAQIALLLYITLRALTIKTYR